MPLHRPSNTLVGWEATMFMFVVKEDFQPMAPGKTEKKAASTSASPTVGREELSRRIAQEADLSLKQAQAALETTLKAIREALQKGNEVRLVGFGSFKVRTSAARKGVNPRDQKPIHVPAKERVRFFPGKDLADSVVKKK